MTMQKLAEEAIQVQDACNMGGVSRRFAEVVQEIHKEMRESGKQFSTQDVNRHPVVRLWASKIHDMSGMGSSDMDQYEDAYDWCARMAVVLEEKP